DPAEGAFTPDAGRLPLPSGAGNPIRPCDLLQARTLAEHLDTLIERRSGSTEEPVQPLSKEDRKHVKAELTRLEKWIAARERSLLGRIADHLGGQIVEGRDVLAKALHRVKAGAP